MHNSGREARRGDAGQNVVEYVGVALLVAVAVGAVVVLAPLSGVTEQFDRAVCLVLQQPDCGGDSEPPQDPPELPPQDPPEQPPPTEPPEQPPPTVPPPDAPYEERLETYAQNSALGREALALIEEYDLTIVYRSGEGSYWNAGENTIVIDTSQPPEVQFGTLVHEVSHARYSHEGRSADPEDTDRQEYVDSAIEEESVGTVLEIRAIQQAQQRLGADAVPDHFLQQAYEDAYEQGIREAEARAAEQGRTLSATERRAAGEEAGTARVREAFNSGEVVTSTTGDTYPEYYGQAWDDANDCTLWVFC